MANATEFVIAYDPASGKELWRSRGVESNAIHTPLAGHGLVFVTAGYPEKKVIALRPGDVPAAERVAWEYSKGTGYVISNILYGDYLYLVTDNGIVTCLDPKTGAVKYEGGRVPVPARFTGSPVAFGGYVALTSQDGDTFMLKAGPRHEVVRTNAVGEPVMSSPAIANGRIYIQRAEAPVRDRVLRRCQLRSHQLPSISKALPTSKCQSSLRRRDFVGLRVLACCREAGVQRS